MALGAVLALATYLIIARFLPTVPKPHFGPAGRVIVLASVIVACAAAPLAHELGHVLGGMVVRFRFTMLAWGPFRVVREGKHIRIGLNRNINYIGGIALSLPRTLNHLAGRTAVVIAMGPMTSLALGVGSLLLSDKSGIWQSPAAMSDPVRAFGGIVAAAFGVASLGIALVTLVPGRTSGLLTDGAQILRYIRGGPAVDRHSALMALVGLSSGDTRPRDWPIELVRRLTVGEPSDTERTLADMYDYYQALDNYDAVRAHRALSSVLDRTLFMGRKGRAPYAQEAAFYELVIRGDAAAAELWLAEELAGAVSDQRMRTVLFSLVALAQAIEEGDVTTATEARSRLDAALRGVAARSGIERLRADLIVRRAALLPVA